LQEPCPKDLHQKFPVWPKTCPIIAHKKSFQNVLEVLGCHLCHNIASPGKSTSSPEIGTSHRQWIQQNMLWWSWLVAGMNPCDHTANTYLYGMIKHAIKNQTSSSNWNSLLKFCNKDDYKWVLHHMYHNLGWQWNSSRLIVHPCHPLSGPRLQLMFQNEGKPYFLNQYTCLWVVSCIDKILPGIPATVSHSVDQSISRPDMHT
jgi:hypothetical protein